MRFARARLAPLVSVLHLRHESHDVAFRVAEFGEPEVVVRHSGDQVRFGLRMNVVLHEACEGGMNVGNREVQYRRWMVEFGALRRAKHKANAATIEEGELAGSEE